MEYSPGSVAIQKQLFQNNVDITPYSISHQLCDHPLLQVERLVELAKRLPNDQREYVYAKSEFGTHEDLAKYNHADDADACSTDDIIRNIETQNMIVVLRNVESDSEYGKFVNACLDDLKSQVEPITGPISGRESFIFISPPQAYTPYHYDPEQNFFLQIRGQKQMAIYDVNDREVLPEEALEKYYGENQVITKCEAGTLFDRHQLFDMQPGDGVYVPVTAPHWVRTLNEISVSISINFRTPSSIRRARVFRANRLLRKLGVSPQTVSPRADSYRDRTKSSLLEIPARIKKILNPH